eukprot:360517-Chlamydomonas_euryale.AAC.5
MAVRWAGPLVGWIGEVWPPDGLVRAEVLTGPPAARRSNQQGVWPPDGLVRAEVLTGPPAARRSNQQGV